MPLADSFPPCTSLQVQLFMGRFAYCTDPSVETRAMCNGTFDLVGVDGTLHIVTRRWENPDSGNFDNVRTQLHADRRPPTVAPYAASTCSSLLPPPRWGQQFSLSSR